MSLKIAIFNFYISDSSLKQIPTKLHNFFVFIMTNLLRDPVDSFLSTFSDIVKRDSVSKQSLSEYNQLIL